MPLLAIFDETDRISCICLHVYADGSLAFSNARFTTPPVDVTSAAAYVTCVCIDWQRDIDRILYIMLRRYA